MCLLLQSLLQWDEKNSTLMLTLPVPSTLRRPPSLENAPLGNLFRNCNNKCQNRLYCVHCILLPCNLSCLHRRYWDHLPTLMLWQACKCLISFFAWKHFVGQPVIWQAKRPRTEIEFSIWCFCKCLASDCFVLYCFAHPSLLHKKTYECKI